MAKEKETKKELPTVIEGKSREDVMKAIGMLKADNPDVQANIIQFDGSRENPFWAEIIKS